MSKELQQEAHADEDGGGGVAVFGDDDHRKRGAEEKADNIYVVQKKAKKEDDGSVASGRPLADSVELSNGYVVLLCILALQVYQWDPLSPSADAKSLVEVSISVCFHFVESLTTGWL